MALAMRSPISIMRHAFEKQCGRSSVVEHHVANVNVVSSNLIARSNFLFSPPVDIKVTLPIPTWLRLYVWFVASSLTINDLGR